MAVSKLWSVTERLKTVIDYATNPEKTTKGDLGYQSLKDVISYAKNEEKTEREFFCQGINCNAAIARDQFVAVKEQYDKTDGIQAYHGYLSFKETNLTPELAQKIGMEFASKVWGKRFQVVVTTHLNTKHLHCHFVINSVSFVDGKRLQNEEKAWFKFRLVADELCRKYGLHVLEKPERNLPPKFKELQDKAGLPTRYNLTREAIDSAIQQSRNKEQFKYLLKEMGYTLDYNPRHKYWTIIPKGYEKPIRLYRLGAEYEQNRILERLRENRTTNMPVSFQKVKPQKPAPKKQQKKISGLHGLYLYYCYLLRSYSAHPKHGANKLHYLLREDLIRLDELTEQVTLLGQHNIQTDEELAVYKRSVEERIASLTAKRSQCKSSIRRVDVTEKQQEEIREQISSITDELKELRRERKLCDGIATRSGIISKKVEQLTLEETEGKERKQNEQQR